MLHKQNIAYCEHNITRSVSVEFTCLTQALLGIWLKYQYVCECEREGKRLEEGKEREGGKKGEREGDEKKGRRRGLKTSS